MLLGIAWAQQSSGTAPASSAQTSGQTSSGAKSSTPSKPATGAAHKPATAAAHKPATAAAPITLKTDLQKQSYAMGMNLGTGLHRQGITLDPALVARGLKDAQSGGKTLLTDDEARTVLTQWQANMRQKMETKSKEEDATNRKAGEDFLAANKSKPGIVTLPDGLQYKILKEGTGPKPTASDTVSCDYKGTLINGKEFDSSCQARRSGLVSGGRSDQGMDRGAAVDAGRIDVATVHPRRSGLWGSGRGRGYWAGRHAGLRSYFELD